MTSSMRQHPIPRDPFDPDDPLRTPLETKIQSTFSPRVGIAYPVTGQYGVSFHRTVSSSRGRSIRRSTTTWNDSLPTGAPPCSVLRHSNPRRRPVMNWASWPHSAPARPAQVTFFSKKIENLIGVAWIYLPHAYAYYVNEDFAAVKGFEVAAKSQAAQCLVRCELHLCGGKRELVDPAGTVQQRLQYRRCANPCGSFRLISISATPGTRRLPSSLGRTKGRSAP